MENKKVLIRMQDLTKYFPLKKRLFQTQLFVRANEGITLDIYEGETFGLVGESGSGKSTLGRVILQLYQQTSGSILYYGKTLEEFKPRYVKRTINNLPGIMERYRELSKELGDDFQNDTSKLDKQAKAIISKYADAVRIAGGLVVADDMQEVSRVLMAEYDAGVAHFKVADRLEALTMNLDVLAEKGDKVAGDEKQIAEYKKEFTELTAKMEKVSAQLAEKREALKELRARVSVKPGFEVQDKLQDDGIDLARLSTEEMRVLRRELQIIFQDPYSSLNQRLTVGQLISEALTAHNIFKRGSKLLENYVIDIMSKCGLQGYMLHRYPHQFSGGQRQRIGIARALSVMPKFIVCDEAVSALDVSIQSQIINLLIDLKEQENLTYLFITHDLSVVKFISDRIAVMYLGSVVELSTSDKVFHTPYHPYTEALMEAIPTTEDNQKELAVIKGDIPSAINPPSGCKFHTRCKYATDKCKDVVPEWLELDPGHFVACHYPLNRSEQDVQKTKGASA